MADEFADIWDEEGTDLDVAMKSSQRAEDDLFKVLRGLILFINLDIATKPLRVTIIDTSISSLFVLQMSIRLPRSPPRCRLGSEKVLWMKTMAGSNQDLERVLNKPSYADCTGDS